MTPTARPIAVDLFCGLGGWTEGLLTAGYRVLGFDIERHVYGEHRYPAQLVLQDVRTIDGRQFRDASLIVASPPCQRYSWMAMPWRAAKAKAAWYRGHPERVAELNELFDACFRIQREASAAAGRRIPLVVENVCGAQPWVGQARWHFGSYYLWGDVPALMPAGRGAIKNTGGSWFNVAHNTTSGKGRNPHHDCSWFGKDHPSPMRKHHSKSERRKAASALIAKIPFRLAHWIGKAWLPRESEAS